MMNKVQRRSASEIFFGLSIFGQLGLFLTCFLPLLWMAGFYDLQKLHERIMEDARQKGLIYAYALAEQVNASVKAIDMTLIGLRYDWINDSANFAEVVSRRQAFLEKGVGFQIGIIDANGLLVFSSVEPNLKRVDLSDREHFQVHRRSQKDTLFISQPLLGRVSQRWGIQFTRPIYDDNGKFRGVIIFSVAPAYFNDFYSGISLGAANAITLVKTSGEILARSTDQDKALGKSLTNLPFSPTSKGHHGIYQRASQVDGIERVYAWHKLDRINLAVIVGESVDTLLVNYRRQKNTYLVLGIVSSLFITIIGYLLLIALQHKRRAANALAESEERWKFAVEGTGDGMWDWNVLTGELQVSARWKEMLGWQNDERMHHIDEWSKSVHPDDLPQVMVAIQGHLDGKTPTFFSEQRMLCKDGSWKWILCRGLVVSRDTDGKALRAVGTHTDITERKNAEQEIHQLAFFDYLTHLPNRRLMVDRVRHALAISDRFRHFGAVLLIDLDNFKTLNDSRGHQAGDMLLQEVARRLSDCGRASDTVARFGGDEFVVILEALGHDRDEAAVHATYIANKVLAAIGQPFVFHDHAHTCTASIGIALFMGRDTETEDLLKRADLAMYHAKSIGRNAVSFFMPEMQAKANTRMRYESDMRTALQEGEFFLVYQPQVDALGNIVGVEALMRWRHPELGLISPAEFIPVAEETGLIVQLGYLALENAFRQLAEWARHPLTADLSIAINVSAQEFHDPSFVTNLFTLLQQSGARPDLLKIELTESMLVKDLEITTEVMERLRADGIQFALDDFGTGYSSLAYLKRLPIDQLKIDQSFVWDATKDKDSAAIVTTIIALGQALGMTIIAEGVETTAQMMFLKEYGCNVYQGYLFSQPLAPDEFGRWLARRCASDQAVPLEAK